MSIVRFPYGKEFCEYDFKDENLLGVLTSSLHEYKPTLEGIPLVQNAIDNPIGSERLCELAKGKDKVVIIASLLLHIVGRIRIFTCTEGEGQEKQQCNFKKILKI